MDKQAIKGFEYEIEQTARFLNVIMAIIGAAKNVLIAHPGNYHYKEQQIAELIYDFANRTAINVPESARQIVMKAITEPYGERQEISQAKLDEVEAYLIGSLNAVISSGAVYHSWEQVSSRKSKL